MAYSNHYHLSQDLPLPNFKDQHQQSTQLHMHTDTNPRTILDSSSEPTSSKRGSDRHQLKTAPNWLNNALLYAEYGDSNNGNNHNSSHINNTSNGGATNNNNNGSNFLNLHTAASYSGGAATQMSNQWLSSPILQRNQSDVIDNVTVAAGDAIIAGVALSHDSADLNAASDALHKKTVTVVEDSSGGRGGDSGSVNWQNASYKADILAHPLYEQLLSAHVTCLRIATPVDQLPRIDAQLAQSQNVVVKYSTLGHAGQTIVEDDKELDQFMSHYVLLLCSFKEQLQQHVRVHAMEAVMACWEIEQSLQSLTGISPGEGTGATMSDDEDDHVDSDSNLFDGNFDAADSLGFGPLVPTESERSLIERVRQELKRELKHGYKEKIIDIREEILRKRRAGKLPGDTTSVLKDWWQSHSKWPYPTEEDKARLVQETGLQLKQINNWFINQRKRNWHSNPSTSAVLMNKRKR